MSFDFSIESSIEKIQNTNTKGYFKEVYQTFVNNNYRSSTVMLYSVLICDLVYKLRDLRDIYGDTKAKKILDEIEILQASNPNSPEWESKLIEFIKGRTTLLEPSDIVAIESLQKFRHLSAHPVLNNSDLLYSPNRDTVQSLIRNILEGVLTNPPFFSNKIFDTMLADLTEVKDKIGDDEGLEKYVKSRYINRLKETDLKKIFRSLWKVVFITDDLESVNGRLINYKVLKVFISNDKSLCIESIRSEPHFYSNVNKKLPILYLINLFSIFPEFHSVIDGSLKQLIKTEIKSSSDAYLVGWFLKPSIKEHLEILKKFELKGISENAFKHMMMLCEQNGCSDKLIDFAIEYFGKSDSFLDTGTRYESTSIFWEKLNLEQTNRLLELANANGQILGRTGMKSKLVHLVEKFNSEIEHELYPRIFSKK